MVLRSEGGKCHLNVCIAVSTLRLNKHSDFLRLKNSVIYRDFSGCCDNILAFVANFMIRVSTRITFYHGSIALVIAV